MNRVYILLTVGMIFLLLGASVFALSVKKGIKLGGAIGTGIAIGGLAAWWLESQGFGSGAPTTAYDWRCVKSYGYSTAAACSADPACNNECAAP